MLCHNQMKLRGFYQATIEVSFDFYSAVSQTC